MPKAIEPTYLIEAFSKHHDRTGFSCGIESLDRYLHQQISQDLKRNAAAPFVLIEQGSPKVLGYYTMSAFSVALQNIPKNLQKQLPHYPQVPATLIGRLAVDQTFHGKRLGEKLLINALRRAYASREQIASAVVVVDVINENAVTFYAKYGFMTVQNEPNRLFLPMDTISKLPEWPAGRALQE